MAVRYYGTELAKALVDLDRERQWFSEHGASLEAYIRRYGEPGTDHCYGDGGAAIYEADELKLRIARNRVNELLAKSLDKIIGRTNVPRSGRTDHTQ